MRIGSYLLAASLALLTPEAGAQLSGDLPLERVATGFRFLQGPVWALDDTLLFTDTVTDQIYKLAPGKGRADAGHAEGGASGMSYDTKENLYVCEFRARRVTRKDKKGKLEVLAERFEGKRLNAPNDVVVRRDGNVYFTDPAFGNQQDEKELEFYGVFRVTPRGELQAIARWQSRPTGVALSPDGRVLYVSDADAQTVHAFDLDRNGAASNDRVLIAQIEGVPGGLQVDEAGNIYLAARDVLIYSAKGVRLRAIHLAETPSNLAFGDPDFSSLYVTARTSIYRIRMGVKGAVHYLP